MSENISSSQVPPPVDETITKRCSPARRYAFLAILCLGYFPGIFSLGAIFPAILFLEADLHIPQSNLTWIINAFNLTISSFLLIVRGFTTLSTWVFFIFSIFRVDGSVTFITQVRLLSAIFFWAGICWQYHSYRICLQLWTLCFRHFVNRCWICHQRNSPYYCSGIERSRCVHTTQFLSLTVLCLSHIFCGLFWYETTDERVSWTNSKSPRGWVAYRMWDDCSRSVFLTSISLSIVSTYQHIAALGLSVGAALSQFVNWSWIFWLAALIALPTSAIAVFLIPKAPEHGNGDPIDATWKHLDLLGVGILTGNKAVREGWTNANAYVPSCHHALRFCYHIGIQFRMGVCEDHRASYDLDVDVCGILLLWNKDSPFHGFHVRMNRPTSISNSLC